MKKVILILGTMIVIVILLLAGYVFVKLKSIKPIDKNDVTINNVKAQGVITNETLNHIGKLLKIDEKRVEEGLIKEYIYPDYTLFASYNDEKKQWEMNWFTITGKNFQTKRGLKLGDSYLKVLGKYGFSKVENNNNENVCTYGDIGNWIQFNFKKNRLKEIAFH